MSKKKKKKNSNDSGNNEFKGLKLFRKWMIRFILIGGIVFGVYYFLNGSTNTTAQNISVPIESKDIKLQLENFFQEGLEKIEIPKRISSSIKADSVDQVASNLSSEIKKLPDEQLQKLKIQFCDDVLGIETNRINN